LPTTDDRGSISPSMRNPEALQMTFFFLHGPAWYCLLFITHEPRIVRKMPTGSA